MYQLSTTSNDTEVYAFSTSQTVTLNSVLPQNKKYNKISTYIKHKNDNKYQETVIDNRQYF